MTVNAVRLFSFAAVLALLLPPATRAAQSPSPSLTASPPAQQPAIEFARSRVDRMLRTGHVDPSWFSSNLSAQGSADAVDSAIAELTKALGAYQSVEYTPSAFIARFAKGTDDVLIHLDADNKIDSLFFRPPVVSAGSLDEALGALRRQSGTLSYVIVEEGRAERANLDPSQALAVGSAFKLAVLNALLDEITRRSRDWREIVPLQHRWKSIPSGILQTWPDETPLTLATYATEMISISDNTAADALLQIVGPKALQRYAAGNDPFLTTREVAALKSREGDELRAAYLSAATPSARAAVLERVDALPVPAVSELLIKPLAAVEWHYSVRQLCRLIERVASLPLMSINPGAADAQAFAHIAYKGGSDFGIINMTTMVTTRRGSKLCFSATLNNASSDVDEAAFGFAYGGVLAQLAKL